MKVKVRLRDGGLQLTDVTVTADATACVGDVADALLRAWPDVVDAPLRGRSTFTLGLTTPDTDWGTGYALDRTMPVAESGLRSGSVVEVFPVPGDVVPAARVTIYSGPDAGLVYDLLPGSTVIGRQLDYCLVVLSDPYVSRRHLQIRVGQVIEVTDLQSSSGTLVNGVPVASCAVGAGDLITIGGTTLTITPLRDLAAEPQRFDHVDRFNRAPHAVVDPDELELVLPAPPGPTKPSKLPLIAMLAPLVMGLVMFMVMQNPMTLIFVGMAPLIAAATYVDKRVTDKKSHKEIVERFAKAITEAEEELVKLHQQEADRRRSEIPTTQEAITAAMNRGLWLWRRRADQDHFLSISLGLGTAESRVKAKLPSRGDASKEDWEKLTALEAAAKEVHQVPIVADLLTCGSLGLAGPPAMVAEVARGAIGQVAALHSPAEVTIAAIVKPESVAGWDWLKWLPHIGSPHSALPGQHLASAPADVPRLTAQIEELLGLRRNARPHINQPRLVLLVEEGAQVERGRLVQIAEDGPACGIHVIWIAETLASLPAACHTYLELDPTTGTGSAGLVKDKAATQITNVERLPWRDASALALSMAPVVDAGAPVLDDSDLPRAVNYVTLAGTELITQPAAVIDQWRAEGTLRDPMAPPIKQKKDAPLRGLIGQGASGEFWLDLRSQGPHALVGGTTGAGKSEFLQSWVIGMAASNSPQRVTFLFVDYKGGAAFADCVKLPHCVGLVTDLSPHLVRRALTSMHAELRRREHLLNEKAAKDLVSLERTGDPDTPPALVIVVDEFAALVSEVPEFVDGMVDVAQRGRSLGLHLILATQRPAGVIKDNLRANTPLRIALRMADESDSGDVLGDKMAAHFDPSIPGRAAVRTGPGRIQTFQTGYLGGRTSSRPSPPRVGVASLQFGPSDEWDVPPPALPADAQDAEGPTDIAAAVDVIGSAAELAGLPEPRKPWLPELDQHFDLAELWDTVGHEDTGWLLGMMDDPGEQSRRAVFYSPSGHGNLAIYGSVGAGKSQALRTLVLSAAQNWQTDPTEVYVIDAGSGAMAAVSPLPAVGDVIDSTDDERILRLMRQLTEQLDQRVSMFAQVNASSLEEYRSNSGQLDFPRVLLVLDGFSAFRDRFETDRSLAPGYAALARVLAEGRSVGIHVVMSAERPGSLPTALVPTISRKLILRQADPNSYLQLQIPKDVLSAASAPGRSVFAEDTREVQIAMLGQPASGAAQAAAIAELAEALAAEGAPSATGIRRLASMLAVEELPAQVNGKPVLGIESGTLEPFGFDPSGMLIVAGLPGSGRTSTVLALSTALRRFSQTMELYYVGPRTSPVGKLDMWDGIANDPTTAVELFAQIKGRFEIPAEPGEEAGLVIESIGDLFGPPADVKAQELFKLAKRNGHLVIAEGEQSVWNASWGLMQELRSQRRGILLQPDSADGEVLFRTPFPRGKRSDYPLGRGVWVESGKCKVVQLPFVGGPADGMALLAAQALGNDG